jgi:hypothetical protein
MAAEASGSSKVPAIVKDHISQKLSGMSTEELQQMYDNLKLSQANIMDLYDTLNPWTTTHKDKPLGKEAAASVIALMHRLPHMSFSVTDLEPTHATSYCGQPAEVLTSVHVYHRAHSSANISGLDVKMWSFRYHGYQMGKDLETWQDVMDFLSRCSLSSFTHPSLSSKAFLMDRAIRWALEIKLGIPSESKKQQQQ